MKEFKKILRQMQAIDYIRIAGYTFYKRRNSKFCLDGTKEEFTQKQLCNYYKNDIELNNYRVII